MMNLNLVNMAWVGVSAGTIFLAKNRMAIIAVCTGAVSCHAVRKKTGTILL